MEERLLFHNPWWSDPTRIDSDKKIKAIEKTSIKWRQEKVVHFDLEKDAIYTLRGPRQEQIPLKIVSLQERPRSL